MDRCLVCGRVAPPLSRRTIHPPLSGSHGIREFFVRFVKPGFAFPDGQSLFVCKKPCFSKLEQGMNKVSAVEKILRDLRGPADATLLLSVATETRVVFANACTQTKPVSVSVTESSQSIAEMHLKRGASTTTATAIATKRQKASSSSSIRESFPSTPVSMLGKHRLHGGSQPSRAKRFRALKPVSLSVLLDEGEAESVVPVVQLSSSTLAENSPSPSRQQSNPEGRAEPLTPVSRQHTRGVQSPHSLMKVTRVKGRTSRKFVVSSPYKRLVKTLRYNQPGYTARCLMKTPSIREATLAEFLKVIRTECSTLCMKLPLPSVLRVLSARHLNNFRFDTLIDELKRKAPTLLAILTAAAQPSRSKKQKPNPHVIAMAAAVLMKQRNKHLCMLQTIVGCLLHSGHAAKRVYTRLSKLGLCISHTTVTNVTKSLGRKYDQRVHEWKLTSGTSPSQGSSGNELNAVEPPVSSNSCASSTIRDKPTADAEDTTRASYPHYILVGDNIDKNVSPRDMRVDHQTKSFHYFHSYAVHDRIDLSGYSNQIPDIDIESLPLTTFLPSLNDCKKLRDNYIVLASRVLVTHLPFLAPLKGCVPQHIEHVHLKELTKKSDVVPVGVIPRNENVKEEITEILEQLQSSYVPTSADGKLDTVAFGGDQLTVERSRNAQARRVNSDSPIDALQGLEPFAADWHAEANYLQIIFSRLYSGGSNCDSGTLLQLRNQLNRRNIASNPDGRFNASIDFLELVTESHILAAGMHFFGLKDAAGSPSFNHVPSNIMKSTAERQWCTLSATVGCLIDRYVIVQQFTDLQPKATVPRPRPDRLLSALEQNPHAARVVSEHAYIRTASSATPTTVQKRRQLPQWLKSRDDRPHASQAVHDAAPDGVFDYACAVLNDGLLLLEFRDAIHEGDGERILRCWKFLMLYFRIAGHTKYALEAFTFQAKVNGITSPRIQQQLLWSRVVNSKGGTSKNIPVDLHMEHLNRLLKDVMIGLRANISESSIVNASKSLNAIVSLSESFDEQLGIHRASIHHTKKSSDKDRQVVLQQLTDSKVFDYTPGRKHIGFKNISPNIARGMDADALFRWVTKHKKKLAKQRKFQKLFGQHQ